MLNYWKDRLEERLAGVDASISKLEEHIARDYKEEVTVDDGDWWTVTYRTFVDGGEDL